MINTALAYRRAIHEFTLDETNGLLDFVLSTEEWNILTDLRDAFKDATLYFSRDSATIATVIPAMDKLDSMLATAILTKPDGEKKAFTPTVQIALVYAKRTLNRYYAKAYYNRVQRTCLILHPRYKIGYMCDNDWDEDDIKAATKDVREIYDSYANYWKEAQEARVETEGDDNLSDMDEEVSTVRSSITVLDHEY
ncbi:hypothetical protein B0H14DRAFT_2369678 [Mycena olivaceomarginata]|nr:hypothetical protein B0H14DRAFT_2369678 [Mycena olivaceomarginata]